MSRRSPYTASLPFVRLRAGSHRPSVILSVHESAFFAIRHAGISHPLRFCSMSRRSPYTSSLPFVRLRASSHRPSVILSVHGSLLTRKKKPPVFSDKRKSQQHKLLSVCSFQNARKHTWIQMSTWSGLEKAYINKPFSFISCGHNHPNNISRVICIAGCIA